MTVAIITDSAASLPPDLVEHYGIGVVPIHVRVGGQDYRDGEIPLDEVIRRLGEGVTTSGPAPGEFAEAIQAALQHADEVCVLTIASTMSSTFNAARVACEAQECPTRVFDTQTAAGAEALVVLAAAAVARAGRSLDEVEGRAKEVAGRVRLIATVDSLDQLVRSGRVPGLAGWAARSLGVNPLFEFREGKVRRLRPAFSREAALDRIVGACRQGAAPGARLHVAALHAADHGTAQRLLQAAVEGVEVAESFIG